jgi:hypothetical protein
MKIQKMLAEDGRRFGGLANSGGEIRLDVEKYF